MKSLLLGIVLGVLIVLGGIYLYFSRGFAPVATAAPPMPFEASLPQNSSRAPQIRVVLRSRSMAELRCHI
jgi:hypothetical protein